MTTTTEDFAKLRGYLDAFEVLNYCNILIRYQIMLLPPAETLAQSFAVLAIGHDCAGDVPASPVLDQHPLEDGGRDMLVPWLFSEGPDGIASMINVGELVRAWPRVSTVVEAILGTGNSVEDAIEWLYRESPEIAERSVERLLVLAEAIVGRPMQVSVLGGVTGVYWDQLFGGFLGWHIDPWLLEGPDGRLLLRCGYLS